MGLFLEQNAGTRPQAAPVGVFLAKFVWSVLYSTSWFIRFGQSSFIFLLLV
ncbi:hypothetical protein HanIR_Chr09g0416581 [Helianthus annuus]|nr:hypothetical protein HanIR_Chr09g0416581 [Helianthus annuus]